MKEILQWVPAVVAIVTVVVNAAVTAAAVSRHDAELKDQRAELKELRGLVTASATFIAVLKDREEHR